MTYESSMNENDEDIIELERRVKKILKKGPNSNKRSFVGVTIDIPGKITRFRKKSKERVSEKSKSSWLIDESLTGFKE